MENQIRAWRAGLSLALFAVLCTAFHAGADHHENWIEIKSPHFTAYSNAGESEGRRVAAQFEQIRALFEQSFPKLRVDSGDKPTILYALRNEDSLKLLMPTYGQNKNAMKIAGFYFASGDKNFAVVRTDVTGSAANQFHVMYHEYAHGVFRLNFRGLPLWLDEGLAEYWGGSEISNKEARVGIADADQIRLLQKGPLLPIDTLVSIDRTSPLYNTQTHSGIFYAESWALVHYLILAPEMRNQNLLNKFMTALQETDDPIEAANRSFGDLKKLGGKVEAYAQQLSFYQSQVPLHISISEKEFTARRLSPAEGIIHQADYLLHSNHLPEAIELLHQAAELDSKSSGLHDALGYYHYLKNDMENAGKEFDLALEADASDATVFYYRAHILLRKSGYTADSTPTIRTNLEKVLALRPAFAPAHAFLCIAYIQSPETTGKAVQEALRATDLEPGNLAYFIDLGRALLADGKIDNARRVAERAQKSATWPRERIMADTLMKQVNAKSNPSGAQDSAAAGAGTPAPGGQPAPQDSIREAVGQITELICGHPPALMFTLATPDEPILLQVKDLSKIEIHESPGNAASGPANCGKWKDRKAKVTFSPTPGGPAAGEVKSIYFE